MRKLEVGLIGTGWISSEYLRAFQRDSRFKGIANLTSAAVEAAGTHAMLD